ncbi:hypothetical protein TRSC58_07424 [Trypanosoma rangeli SC58]|uniref:Secreted peptide n=1 Tax=Trypanosoma rangeli SC58 TaxID=429131 RepID=A0A061IRM2_TRYRA|nr:hypothetical protein TRSC58_07424 [Trypanosoma rangeli SC58]
MPFVIYLFIFCLSFRLVLLTDKTAKPRDGSAFVLFIYFCCYCGLTTRFTSSLSYSIARPLLLLLWCWCFSREGWGRSSPWPHVFLSVATAIFFSFMLHGVQGVGYFSQVALSGILSFGR